MAEPFDTIGASFADVIDRLAKGEITEAQAGAALAPLLAATNDGEFGARVQEIIGVMGRVTGTLIVDAPPSNLLGAPGSNAWDRVHKVFYGPKDAMTGWPPGDAMTEGPEGKSAKTVVIEAGFLPANATDQDFLQWLADAQIDKVQPFADAAAASAVMATDRAGAAATAATAAETAQDAAEQAKAVAVAASSATAADRTATGADRTAVAMDRAATEAAASAAVAAAGTAGSAASAAGTAADDAVAARGDALTAQTGAETAATATGADRTATGADRTAVAADRTAVAADRAAAETAAATATVEAGEASGHADDAETARVAAVAAKVAAELARDQAQEIVGGDFLTETEGNTLYRKLLDLLNIADVDGLAAALASKATPADVTAAINALVGAAPGTLDTIYELAAWAQDSGDALAALTTLVAGKASQADFDVLATAVGGKASQGALDALAATVGAISVPVKATGAELRIGTDDAKFATAKSLTDADAWVEVTTSGAWAPNFGAGRNFSVILNGALTFNTPTNMKDGQSGTIRFQQDATGSRTVGVNAAIKKVGAYTLSTAANAVDRCGYIVKGTALELTALEKGIA